jgi:hypothetical protein
VALPKEIPKGVFPVEIGHFYTSADGLPAKFNVKVEGYTKQDDPMLCLDLCVDFMHQIVNW